MSPPVCNPYVVDPAVDQSGEGQLVRFDALVLHVSVDVLSSLDASRFYASLDQAGVDN